MDDGTVLWVENQRKDLKRNLRLFRTTRPDGDMNNANKLSFALYPWCSYQTMQNEFSHTILGNNMGSFNYRRL